MPDAHTQDGAHLSCEEAGSGVPVFVVHEFGHPLSDLPREALSSSHQHVGDTPGTGPQHPWGPAGSDCRAHRRR